MATKAFSKLTKAFSWCQNILTHFLTILFSLFAVFCHFFAIFPNEVIKRLTGRYYTVDTNLPKKCQITRVIVRKNQGCRS